MVSEELLERRSRLAPPDEYQIQIVASSRVTFRSKWYKLTNEQYNEIRKILGEV